MLTESELLKEALELPANQRFSMVRKLLESLESADVDRRELEDAWAVEIEERAAAYDRGESQSVDGREAIERIRSSIQRGAAS